MKLKMFLSELASSHTKALPEICGIIAKKKNGWVICFIASAPSGVRKLVYDVVLLMAFMATFTYFIILLTKHTRV